MSFGYFWQQILSFWQNGILARLNSIWWGYLSMSPSLQIVVFLMVVGLIVYGFFSMVFHQKIE